MAEIEAHLAELEGVRDVVVIVREDEPGERCLVAYYTSTREDMDAKRLSEHAASKLPDYMMPTAYVRLERLPLTPNGKVDRKSLPQPESPSYARHGYQLPVGRNRKAPGCYNGPKF